MYGNLSIKKSDFVGSIPYHGMEALWRLPLSDNRVRVMHVKTQWIRFGEAQ